MTKANERKITIVGLGPGNITGLPLGTYKMLKESTRIWLRTEVHPAAQELKTEGVRFATFDDNYEKAVSFEQVYSEIARIVCAEAEREALIYAVPGHPMVAERSVQEILGRAEELGILVDIVPAMSFLDVLFPVLQMDPVAGLCLVDGLTLPEKWPASSMPTVITQVYNQNIASEVKLSLMGVYPDEHMVTVVKAAGVPDQERCAEVPLFELDRLSWVDHLTSVFVPPINGYVSLNDGCDNPLDGLVEVMAELRSEHGCPWDREQTHESLKKYLIEEVYEVLEAIDSGNLHKVCEELGDLLLQIVFHAQIAKENEYFDLQDVITIITEKMIRRHPHVFGDIEVSGSEEVLVNWEQIKAGEKEAQGERVKSALDGVPPGLPALMKAEKIQAKAAKVGFDWPDYLGAWDKVLEETEEVKQAIAAQNNQSIKEELGDLLFAIVNVARFFKVDPEDALGQTINKFKRRFTYIEQEIKARGQSWQNITLNEADIIWEKSKEIEKTKNI